MPESEMEEIDYFPPGWDEEVHDEYYIEWIYQDDPTIFIRLDGTMGDGEYTVSPITGENTDGEEFVTKPVSGLSRDEAFEYAIALVYAINGAIGRIKGESEFSGDIE
jgi:hypothetical protein